jgi:hypothetical protein
MTKYHLEYRELNSGDGWQRWSSPPLSRSEIIHLKESAEVVAVRDNLLWVFRTVPATGEQA